MNAAQRRVTRRTIARAFPTGCTVKTQKGTAATVTGQTPAAVLVKYRNSKTAEFKPAELSRV